MARQTDFTKVGIEDFAMLEQCRKMTSTPLQPQTHVLYQAHHLRAVPNREATIDCYEAAKTYGGLLIVDSGRNKIAPRREAIDCYEAAQKYGGLLIVDNRSKMHSLRKQFYL